MDQSGEAAQSIHTRQSQYWFTSLDSTEIMLSIIIANIGSTLGGILKTIAEIHSANAEVHDNYAKDHDFAVSYIRRKTAANYYFSQINKAVKVRSRKWEHIQALEIGCGTGTFSQKLISKNVQSLCLLDISPAMIETAKKKINDERLSFHVSSLEDFAPKKQKSYDLIFSTSFLHHLYDLDAGLSLISDMLKPGGVYIALHEPHVMHQAKLIEKIDTVFERVERSLKYNLREFGLTGLAYELPRKFIFFLVQKMKRKVITKKYASIHKADDGIELVDYQLNFDFDLMKYANLRKDTEVSYLPYLCFPELLIFQQPTNHQMLVLRKEEN